MSQRVKGYFYDALGHLEYVALVDPARLPPHCTLKPPPLVPAGFVAVFAESEGVWEMESEELAAMAIADWNAEADELDRNWHNQPQHP